MRNFLEDSENLRLVLFGGKGGSGKTTSACAAALHLAQADRKRKILIASADPAHSVSDSFDCSVGPSITRIEGVVNLHAMEIDAGATGEAFRKRHNQVMMKIFDRGTYFDRQDIESFFVLSIPGLDEVMAVIEIADLVRRGDFDLIILDTAPTGHTVRLLDMPAEMERWVHLMQLMQSKHRLLAEHFSGRYEKDDADAFLEMMAGDIGRLKEILSDRRMTEFVPVTIPESMSIEETARLLDHLQASQVPVKEIIINRVAPHRAGCPFCMSRAQDQARHLARIEEQFYKYVLRKMPLLHHEVCGLKMLEEYGLILFGKKTYTFRPPVQVEGGVERPAVTAGRMTDILEKDLQFILFGGKGGVGKTSMASATALALAKRKPDRKVLIFSTDPAHALSDCFAMPVGDRVTLLGGMDNLYGFEIDALKLLEGWKRKYREGLEEAFDRFIGTKVDIKFDREVMTGLFNVTPPGLDELLAMIKICEFLDEEKFGTHVLDLSATGHLVRFLEMPSLVLDWVKTIFRIIIKYKGVVRLMKTAEELLDFSKRAKRIQQILTDIGTTEFVVITIPETMGLAETQDLLAALGRLKLKCRRLVINTLTPPSECDFCSAMRQEQIGAILKVAEVIPGFQVFEVPLLPYNISGTDSLAGLSEAMYGNDKKY